MSRSRLVHVPETRIGTWFLGTETWVTRVLEVALTDLERLIPVRWPSYPVIVDVGCGRGRSFQLLNARFNPERMLGIDVDDTLLAVAAKETRAAGLPVELIKATSCCLPMADRSADMLFCHQTFHHLVDQEAAIGEFFRVLKPGGILLFAESTSVYIRSWLIRYLFRHPMDVQKTAEEYLKLIRAAGFEIPETAVSFPYLWWSRSDLAVMENWFGRKSGPGRKETLVNAVAVRR